MKEEDAITNICKLLESQGYVCFAVDHSAPNWKRHKKDVHGADIIATRTTDMIYIQVDTWSFRSEKAEKLSKVSMPPNVFKEFWVCLDDRPYSVRDMQGKKLRVEFETPPL